MHVCVTEPSGLNVNLKVQSICKCFPVVRGNVVKLFGVHAGSKYKKDPGSRQIEIAARQSVYTHNDTSINVKEKVVADTLNT